MICTRKLPLAFWRDHAERDLPAGKLLRSTHRLAIVEADCATFQAIAADARFYADDDGPQVSAALKASAKATVRALTAAGRKG
jgi:seryl-tRNA synthetase